MPGISWTKTRNYPLAVGINSSNFSTFCLANINFTLCVWSMHAKPSIRVFSFFFFLLFFSFWNRVAAKSSFFIFKNFFIFFRRTVEVQRTVITQLFVTGLLHSPTTRRSLASVNCYRHEFLHEWNSNCPFNFCESSRADTGFVRTCKRMQLMLLQVNVPDEMFLFFCQRILTFR